MEEPKITMYGTTWCGDCHRAKSFFERNDVGYVWVDIDRDAEAARLVSEINKGYWSVPTIVFEDGSVLVEPSNAELAHKLGVRRAG